MGYANDFLAFAIGAGANVESPSTWAGDASLALGFQSGQASSARVNTALRQSTSIAAMIAQFTADYGPSHVQDNGNISTLETQYEAALAKYFNTNVVYFGVDTGAVNVMAASFFPVPTAYADGQIYEVTPHFTNTSTTVTLNANGLGAVNILRGDGSPLALADIVIGTKALVCYNGATGQFLLQNPLRLVTALLAPPITTVYVATTGNDSNPGTSALPFATLQGAINMLSNYSCNSVTINVAAGTYVVAAGQMAGAIGKCLVENWMINCATGTIFNCSAYGSRGIATFGPNVAVYNATVTAYYECYNVQEGGTLSLWNCSGTGITYGIGIFTAYNSGVLWIYGNTYVNSTAGSNAFVASLGSAVNFGYHDVNVTNYCTITFGASSTFGDVVLAVQGGSIAFTATTVTLSYGTVTATKYNAALNGTIVFSGYGLSFLPGDTAGVTSAGGQASP